MSPRGTAEEEDYFQEIERRFALLRGRPLFLSARDAALVDLWWKSGVPLRVVLEAVESVFERRREAGGGSAVRSLSYCRHAVDEAFADWREGRLGAGSDPASAGPAAPDAILAGLERILRERRAAASAPAAVALERAAEAVRDLLDRQAGESSTAPAEVERELERIEARLVDALLAAMPAAERATLEDAAHGEVRSAGVQRSRDARRAELVGLIRAAVRQRAGLPRLSLFP